MLSPLAALIATTAIMFGVAANAQCTAKAGGLCLPTGQPCCEAGGSPALECINRMCQFPVCQKLVKEDCNTGSGPHNDPQNCCKEGTCIAGVCQNSKPSPAPQPPPAPADAFESETRASVLVAQKSSELESPQLKNQLRNCCFSFRRARTHSATGASVSVVQESG